MKRPAFIIAAVAACSLLETLLLLIVLLPEAQFSSWGSRQGLISLSQFLVIPGLAGFFSLLVHGGYRWKRRMFVILLGGTAGIPVAFFLALSPILLLAWAFDTSPVFFWVLLPFVVAAVAWVLLFAIRKTSQSDVPVDAAQWLADRHVDPKGLQSRRRNRAIRWALCFPSLIVLIVLLFLPEIWGLLTHVQQSRAGELTGYEVPIPPTWVIVGYGADQITGRSLVSGIVGRGMGLDIKHYVHFGDLPLSDWSVGTSEFHHGEQARPNSDEATVRRNFQIGKSELSCFEYDEPWGRPMRAHAEPIIFIECSGRDRLHARFQGEKTDVPAFYRMVAGITSGLPR